MSEVWEPLIESKINLLEFCFFYLKKTLYKFISGVIIKPNNILLNVKFKFFYYVLLFFKYNLVLKVNMLLDIVALDSVSRFELVYIFVSTFLNVRFFCKIFLNIENLVTSASSIFFSAGWLEREAWDLYGLRFLFHMDLRRILTDYGFVGHPLLKSFPLTGFVEVRYDDTYLNIVYEPLEISQSLRFFKFENVWFLWRS
jgi:NADH-quinone oxidoreductase subunit C